MVPFVVIYVIIYLKGALMYEAFIGLLPLEIPDPEPVMPPGFGGVSTFLGWLKWLAFAAGGVGIILAAIKFGIGRSRGESAQDAIADIGWPIFGVILAGGGIGLISQFVA
jgi:hypothetical protein